LALSPPVRGGLIAAAIALVAGAFTLNHTLVGVFYDDGLYAGLATALASGLGYVHPHLPGTPGAVHYPPLYPVVLAPLFGLLSVNAAAFVAKILNVLLGASAAGLIAWHIMRTELLDPALPRWVAPTIVTAAAIAIPLLATQSVLFAEPVFAVCLAVLVISVDRRDATGSPLLAGVVAAAALLTRSIGVAAAAGIACFLISRRVPMRTLLLTLAPAAAAALAWGLWVITHEQRIDPMLRVNYGSYGTIVRQSGLSALGVSAPDLPRPLEAITLGWIPLPWLYNLLATLTLGVGLYGLLLLTRRSAIGFILIFYLLILAIWPYPPDRFLWAVLPWLALAWCIGALALARRWRRLRIPIALLALLLVAGYVRYEVQGFAGRWWGTQARAISENFAELLPIVAQLPPTAVVATDDEALVWLYARRQAVPLYLESYRGREVVRPSPAEHWAYLQRMGVSHILLASASSPSASELRRILEVHPHSLTAVYRWPDGRWLFAVNRGP